MINAENKLKYYELKQHMYQLHNNINELQNINNKLIKELTNTLTLDDKIINNKEFAKIENNYQKIDRIILEDIISKI